MVHKARRRLRLAPAREFALGPVGHDLGQSGLRNLKVNGHRNTPHSSGGIERSTVVRHGATAAPNEPGRSDRARWFPWLIQSRVGLGPALALGHLSLVEDTIIAHLPTEAIDKYGPRHSSYGQVRRGDRRPLRW